MHPPPRSAPAPCTRAPAGSQQVCAAPLRRRRARLRADAPLWPRPEHLYVGRERRGQDREQQAAHALPREACYLVITPT
eukprot:scaffold93473_cov30-Phaeocystis_antarctica.AAC.1